MIIYVCLPVYVRLLFIVEGFNDACINVQMFTKDVKY